MPSLKDIRKRITSVKNTQQITRAMKLVAAARMKKATDRAMASRPYADALDDILAEVTKSPLEHPLMTARQEVKHVAVVVVSSDRGLCGAFNAGLFRWTERWLKNHDSDVRLHLLGRKAKVHFERRDWEIDEVLTDRDPVEALAEARALGRTMAGLFESGEVDEVWLVYNRFHSILTQKPEAMRLFPIGSEGLRDATEGLVEEERLKGKDVSVEQVLHGDFVFEPGGGAVMETLLPLYLETRIYQVFLESIAGELAARMRAMDAATRNAGDLIAKLTLQYNRARQAAITKELVEIISGAEAL